MRGALNMDLRRRILVLLAALVVAVAPAGVARGDDETPANDTSTNAAVAVNTKDGSTVFDVAFAIRRVMGPVVDETNIAYAYSSCQQCTSVAIAFEIVLVQGPVTTFTPQNAAIAINEQCTLCTTVAQAYQFVITTDGAVEFDKEGWKVLKDVRKELERLRHENLSPDELQTRLNVLHDRVLDVLENHLVPVEEHDRGKRGRHDDHRSETQTTTTTPTTTTMPTTTETTTTTPPETTTTAPADTTTTPTTTTP
jgi:putative peptide zinc metalloprotease protein